MLFIIGLYASSESSVEAVRIIIGGPFTFLFLFGVILIGMFIPFIFGVYELLSHHFSFKESKEHRPWLSGMIASLILFGGFMLRYIVLYAGQMTHAIHY